MELLKDAAGAIPVAPAARAAATDALGFLVEDETTRSTGGMKCTRTNNPIQHFFDVLIKVLDFDALYSRFIGLFFSWNRGSHLQLGCQVEPSPRSSSVFTGLRISGDSFRQIF